MSPTPKHIAATLASIGIALIWGYWFFMHTNRGGSIAVYVFGGWGAPVEVKWKCGAETDLNVEKKFTLPLLFDTDTKDALRGFWYYSYFRQCLYSNGYDFNGSAVPKSTLTEGAYTNPYGGFSFLVTDDASLLSDNSLDVDFHDQLLVSTIATGGTTLFVHTYLKDDDLKTFDDIKNTLQHISVSKSDIENADVVRSVAGVDVLRVRDTEGTEGVVFITPENHVVYIFGSQQLAPTIDAIAQNLRTF